MHWDAYAKRAFPLIVCAFLAMAAYFQARGVGAMVATEVQPPPPALPNAPRALGAALEGVANADPILERNPFDSEAGSRDEPPEPAPEAPPKSLGSDEGDADKCDVGHVTLITDAENPRWSFASLSPKSGESKLVRIGDSFEGHQVQRIGWKRVWLAKGGEGCVMKLGDEPAAQKPRKRRTRRTRRRRSRRGAQISDEMKNKIHRVSATEYEVERSVIDDILEKQAELMRNTRVRPMKRGDDVVGMRVSRVRSGTLLHTLGMRNGDVIKSINGFDLTDPQKALEAYGRLRSADALKVQIERRGKPTTMEFKIQ